MSYDSPSRAKEGDPIEELVPDAIRATASQADARALAARAERGPRSGMPDGTPGGPHGFIALAALAAVEALALIVLLLGGFGAC